MPTDKPLNPHLPLDAEGADALLVTDEGVVVEAAALEVEVDILEDEAEASPEQEFAGASATTVDGLEDETSVDAAAEGEGEAPFAGIEHDPGLSDARTEEGEEAEAAQQAPIVYRDLEGDELQAAVEATLFMHHKPITISKLRELIHPKIDEEDYRTAVSNLQATYWEANRGIELVEVANGYQLRTKPENKDILRRMYQIAPMKLTNAMLEVLAIAAYNQPLTREAIDKVRGVDSSHLVRVLLDKKMLRIVGKSDEIGRPMLYGTTKEFLELFGLRDLSALPSLRELEDMLPKNEVGSISEEEALAKEMEGIVVESKPLEFNDLELEALLDKHEAQTVTEENLSPGANRDRGAPEHGSPQEGQKPTETSISRQKLLDVSRRDKKATLRAQRFAGVKLPALREETKAEATKAKDDGKERLQKILASAGVCSRRKAEELILLGSVTVNGEVVNTLGAKADPRVDIIAVDGKVVETENTEREYYLLNKPRGYITTTSDPQGRPTVMDLMGGVNARIYPVGRLDYASEGLLLLTNDGEAANKLMHPSSAIRRTYAVKVKGDVTDEQLKTLRKGVQLSDGFVKPVRVARGERLQNKEWVEITVTEGKNLEIRRLFAVLDLDVERLRRIAIGPLEISLVPVGKFVRLTKRQIEDVFADAQARASEAKEEKAPKAKKGWA